MPRLNWWTSWLQAGNAIHAAYRGVPAVAVASWMVLGTSLLNHGCDDDHPMRSYARDTDRILVFFVIFFIILTIWPVFSASQTTGAPTCSASSRAFYLGSVGAALLCALVYAINPGDGEWVHSGLHVMASLGVAWMTESCARCSVCPWHISLPSPADGPGTPPCVGGCDGRITTRTSDFTSENFTNSASDVVAYPTDRPEPPNLI